MHSIPLLFYAILFLLAEISYGSPGRRSSPKPSPSFDVESLATDMVSD